MSPHFGLMDKSKMTRSGAALMRAKLHWRGGRRRLREKKTLAGIAALYDALIFGICWYVMVHLPHEMQGQEEKLEHEGYLFPLVREAGVIDGESDLAGIKGKVDEALEKGGIGFDQDGFVDQVESLLTRIGVLPFDEADLPREDPETF